jgi:hypothetical protein
VTFKEIYAKKGDAKEEKAAEAKEAASQPEVKKEEPVVESKA